jgi:hypothetical protein
LDAPEGSCKGSTRPGMCFCSLMSGPCTVQFHSTCGSTRTTIGLNIVMCLQVHWCGSTMWHWDTATTEASYPSLSKRWCHWWNPPITACWNWSDIHLNWYKHCDTAGSLSWLALHFILCAQSSWGSEKCTFLREVSHNKTSFNSIGICIVQSWRWL